MNAGADRGRGRVVVVEEPAGGCVRVRLPHAQVVAGGDVGHRCQCGLRRADVGDGVALDEHPTVTAQRVASSRPRSIASIDSGSASPTTGTAEITATAVSLPPSTRSNHCSTEKQSAGSAAPHAACGKPDPNVSTFSRKCVCTSTTGPPCTAASAAATSPTVSGPTAMRRPARCPALAPGRPRSTPAPPAHRPVRRPRCGTAARPSVPTGIGVGRRPRPAHRLARQRPERRRQVLAVRARPQLEREPGVVVERRHRPIEAHRPHRIDRSRSPAAADSSGERDQVEPVAVEVVDLAVGHQQHLGRARAARRTRCRG